MMKKAIFYFYDTFRQRSRMFLVFSILVFSSSLFGQDEQMAPINPEFVKYKSGLNQAVQSYDGHTLGLIPEPALPNFVQSKLKTDKAVAFVAKYDLRTAGQGGTSLVTSVKDQGSCGSCWAFGAMGAIEGYAKKMGMGDYDLSENNLKECSGFLYLPCEGGNVNMTSAYISRKSGPISETDDPYSESVTGCKGYLNPQFWISDIRYLPNDASVLKQAILDYGALYTNMYWADASYNALNYTYYSVGATSTNHAVLLVGWDDTKVTAGGTGAWIIRNSWGSSWGENGFFYISYTDTKVNTSVMSFRNITAPVQNSTQFSYDQLGMTSSWGFSSNVGYGLIKFSTGSKDYSLKKLSTFVRSGPATVRFDVYQDFNGSALSNLLGSITDQACEFPGYYTFDLPTPIAISANKDFYVKVYYNTTGYNYPIPVESAIADYTNPIIESGKCWRSGNGTDWFAFGSDQTAKADLCINAYGEYASGVPSVQASSFSVNSITSNSMTINWTRGNGTGVMVVAQNGSAAEINPRFGTSYTANSVFSTGQQLGAGSVVYIGSGSSVNITGLSAGQTYYFAIYEYNSTDNSYKIQPLTGNARTLCGVTSIPFVENFENTALLPSCWTSYIGTNGLGTIYDWTPVSDGYWGIGAAYVKNETVTSGSKAEDWLVTPQITIPAGAAPYLTYYEKQTSSIDYNTQYTIKVSTTSQTDQTSFTDLTNYSELSFGTDYSLRSVNLSAYAGQSIFLAFVSSQNNGDSWYIDNVNVTVPPASAGLITGLTSLCQGQNDVNYTVPAIANAASYAWSLPTGTYITGGFNTNSITVNYSASALSGNVAVKGTNAAGNGALSANLAVAVNAVPVKAGTIVGKTSVGKGQVAMYFVPFIANATSYIWTVPEGITITSGNTTNTITTSFSSSAVSGDITVQGTNGTCTGVISTLPITVTGAAAVENILEKPLEADGLILYPNPASTSVTIETAENNSTVKVYSLDEKLLLQKTVNTKTSLLDIGTLPGGVYLIRVSTTQGTFSRKLIKQ